MAEWRPLLEPFEYDPDSSQSYRINWGYRNLPSTPVAPWTVVVAGG